MNNQANQSSTMKSFAGIGLRSQHLREFAKEMPEIGWVEVHSENYYSLGGADLDLLCKIRQNYGVSLHGIGASLGSAEGIDTKHIEILKRLVEIVEPFLISDHLSWSSTSHKYLPDLLPTPFNKESLDIFAKNIEIVQDILGQEILLENPSTYFEYSNSTMSEVEFLNTLMRKTGARILLDVNNIYVSALNNGWSALEYIDTIQADLIEEVHLSGHSIRSLPNEQKLYIDSHDNYVSDEVWKLYEILLRKTGSKPSLIEWDVDVPKLSVLLDEAKKAQQYLSLEYAA